MKNIQFLLCVSLFFSCSDQNQVESINELSDSTAIDEQIVETCYSLENDKSDSLILMFDEILEKRKNYNRAKFDHFCETWAKVSVSLKNLTIQKIRPSENHGSYTSDPEITTVYGSNEDYFVGWDRVYINIEMEADKELLRFEVGQKINFKGRISDHQKVCADVDDIFSSYNINISCYDEITITE